MQPAIASAAVHGRGPAALTMELVLRRAGWTVSAAARDTRVGPPLALVLHLDPATVTLLGQVWGVRFALDRDGDDGRICPAWPIAARDVHWDAPALRGLPAPGVAVQAAALERALERRLAAEDVGPRSTQPAPGPVEDAGWTVDATGRDGRLAGPPLRLGQRRATLATVRLAGAARRPASPHTAVLEANANGWAYLVPTGPDRGTLSVITPDGWSVSRWLGHSEVIARTVRELRDEPGSQPAMPSLAASWLDPPRAGGADRACAVDPGFGPRDTAAAGVVPVGDAAVAFDPLCGDGVGNGIRSALVAAAAMLRPTDPGPGLRVDALRLYRWRLRRAFAAHVAACADHYRSRCWSERWRGELAGLSGPTEPAHRSKPASRRQARRADITGPPRSYETTWR